MNKKNSNMFLEDMGLFWKPIEDWLFAKLDSTDGLSWNQSTEERIVWQLNTEKETPKRINSLLELMFLKFISCHQSIVQIIGRQRTSHIALCRWLWCHSIEHAAC